MCVCVCTRVCVCVCVCVCVWQREMTVPQGKYLNKFPSSQGNAILQILLFSVGLIEKGYYRSFANSACYPDLCPGITFVAGLQSQFEISPT